MILRAEKDLGLDLARSALVGDKLSDIAAAKVAGVGRSIFLSEKGETAGLESGIHLSSLREIVDYLFPN